MRIKTILIFVIFFQLLGCSKTEQEDKQEIIKLLNENSQCYRKKNLDCIMNTYLNDSNTIALGTEKNFIGKGFNSIRENYKKDISQNWVLLDYFYKNPIIYIQDDFAWLTTDVYSKLKVTIIDEFDISEDIIIELDSRLTAVCRKVNGKWKFVLTNFQHFTNPTEKITPLQLKN